jgi:HTH-type transcriptional regulator, glycine betaine synthesis regulator
LLAFCFCSSKLFKPKSRQFLSLSTVPDSRAISAAKSQPSRSESGKAVFARVGSGRQLGENGTSLEETWQQFFVRLAQSVGLPKSVGLIYGRLFVSNCALAFEDLVEQLPLSKGSVSQGLRVLQRLRAVRPVVHAQDRRSFFEAETSMRKLVGGFLHETVRPRLEQAEEELEHLAGRLQDESNDVLRQRVEHMRRWHAKALRLLPWMVKLTAAPPRGGSE